MEGTSNEFDVAREMPISGSHTHNPHSRHNPPAHPQDPPIPQVTAPKNRTIRPVAAKTAPELLPSPLTNLVGTG
jgi:hypothetical protein